MEPSKKQHSSQKEEQVAGQYQTALSKVEDPVEVFCRIRPAMEGQFQCIQKVNDVTVQLVKPEDVIQNTDKEFKGRHYKFSHVFDGSDSTQKEVFGKVALPLVDDFLHCKNGLLFVFGLKSSGKKFTITGSPENCGILPRMLNVIFNSVSGLQPRKYTFISDGANGFNIQSSEDSQLQAELAKLIEDLEEKPETIISKAIGHKVSQRFPISTMMASVDQAYRYSVFVTFIEIDNDRVYDLLDEENSKEALSIRVLEDIKLAGITEIEAVNAAEAFALFQRGQQRRNSNGRHGVLTIRLVRAPVDKSGVELVPDKTQVDITQLSLVDLAGSVERFLRTGKLKKEGNVNNSLMVLRQCLKELGDKQQSGTDNLIPCQLNNLTNMFRRYFEDGKKVRVVICAGDNKYDELFNAMKFAERAEDILFTLNVEVISDNLFLDEKFTRLSKIPTSEGPWIHSETPTAPPSHLSVFESQPISCGKQETDLQSQASPVEDNEIWLNRRPLGHFVATGRQIFQQNIAELKVCKEKKSDDVPRQEQDEAIGNAETQLIKETTPLSGGDAQAVPSLETILENTVKDVHV